MVLYWTTTQELAKLQPKIFSFNLKKEGMFIGAPGTIIFRTKKEAQAAIDKAHELIEQEVLSHDLH